MTSLSGSCPHVTTASVVRQSPGAEEVGGVCLVAWPDPTAGGRLTSFVGREDAHLAAQVAEVARRPWWRLVLAALLVHPVDSRPSTFARMARAAVDHLPDAPGVPSWHPDDPGRLAASFGSSWAWWTLRSEGEFSPIERPLVSRVQAWRSAIGGSGYFDLRVGFEAAESRVALSPRDEVAARAALADQPGAVVLGLTLPGGLADEVAASMIGRLGRVAVAQAATLAGATTIG